MSEIVLDASALLAILLSEPGNDEAADHLEGACMSSVNLAEVISKLASRNIARNVIEELIDSLGIRIEPMDRDRAVATGMLTPKTKSAGLSLGDRACVSLAEEFGIPALTADRAWQKIETACEIRLIR